MGLLLLIPGIVLEVPNKPWFPGQYGVGDALIWIGVAFIALQLIWTVVIGGFVLSKLRD